MAEKLTPQQHMAVTDRGGKLLVSAAAGSGKTKVLVDRLLSYLTDPYQPANIDDFLIITYTKAAAAELRAKIAAKLSERVAEDPDNRHLQLQMQRLYLTKISTVHAFCGDILREYAYRLDLSADFRVADEAESQELQLRILEQMLDQAYEAAGEDPDFCAFVDSQGFGRDDRQVPQIILKVYNSARCHLDPDEWLEKCLADMDTNGILDAGQTLWGQYLMEDLREYLALQLQALDACIQKATMATGFDKPVALLQQTRQQLALLQGCNKWDDILRFSNVDYGRLTFPKNCSDPLLAEQIKAIRNGCKSGLAKKLKGFCDPSDQILQDLDASAAAARGLVTLVRQFSTDYDRCKRSRRILDFGDLEHKMLDLVLGKSRRTPTNLAVELGRRFREIMVDEYQDTNEVQDAIFSALTHKKQNCFMVGDVKQSIYQFRLADPEIFLKKYHDYLPAGEAAPGQGRKIMLSSNFRSSGGVISAVNDVFTACMSPKVGGLRYGEDEMLREGIPHIPLGQPETELYAISVREDTYAEEAAFVAQRIGELLDGRHMVRQGESLRPITADDIVILLRSPGSVGGEFAYALEQKGIRCSIAGGSLDLLQTEEVAVLYAILQTVSNPLQDIPLVAALSSRVFGFTSDDLAALRAGKRNMPMYEALKESPIEKARHFLQTLDDLRKKSRLVSLTVFLDQVLMLTRMDSIYAAMPDGKERTANIQAFCQLASDYEAIGCRDLARFLERLEMTQERGIAVTSEENTSGAVTIMSIHKSKGLEFPVVFLSGLSRGFNQESARAQVLCHKDLGLGLACVDQKQRVRYPTVAKRAIATKIMAESLSEEMRVLYVAMTRPKDRLIMTYASASLEKDIMELAMRMDLSSPVLLTADVDCPGLWVLQTAMGRTEAGALFALGGKPEKSNFREPAWHIQVAEAPETQTAASDSNAALEALPQEIIWRMQESLQFRYAHLHATQTPSKQTATQLKGRDKDREAAENAPAKTYIRPWREPTFVRTTMQGTDYGTAVHTVMQFIRYEACTDAEGVRQEVQRLKEARYISPEQADAVDCQQIAAFFGTELGQKLRSGAEVIREFKFSILDDAAKYCDGVVQEQVLLQGVVDCALMEQEGITVLDFKTDRITEDTLEATIAHYRPQVLAYAQALKRIYKKEIKSVQLYFFRLGRFAELM